MFNVFWRCQLGTVCLHLLRDEWFNMFQEQGRYSYDNNYPVM